MQKSLYRICAFASLLMLAGRSVCAQQEQQQQQQQQQTQTQGQGAQQPMAPIPAYHSPLASLAAGNDQEQQTNPSELIPDTHSLAGVEDLTLGAPKIERSYWQPSLDVISTFDTNPLLTTGSGGWVAYTNLLGSVDLHRISGNNDLSASYTGGATVSNDSNYGTTVLQEFGLADHITLRRNVISVFEQLMYLPEAGFGYGGLGGLGVPGGGQIGLQSGFLPYQSVITSQGQRVTNSSLAELDTALTHRSSLTFVGGYMLLHFFGSSLLDSGDALFQAGYNYQLSRRDTISVLYSFSDYHFGGGTESFNDNRINAVYGRRVTGRLAFQVGAGPEFVFLNTPAAGVSGGSPAPATPSTNVYWSLHTALTYGLRAGALGLTYDHGVNGGSGVFAGAVGDTVSGSIAYRLAEQLSGGAHFGYSNSKQIATGTAEPSQSFSYGFAGADLERQLGRTLVLGLAYQFQHQISNDSFCIGTGCGKSFTRQTVSISFGWHARPLTF